ncbi:MAG: hypothetical protein ACFE8E_00205 [Candidatus Hodarchaeota archaeon]
MGKAGPIVGLVGGTLMLVAAVIQIQYNLTYMLMGSPISRPLIPTIISIIITVVWASLGISGAFLGLRDKKLGNVLMIIAGAGSLVGGFTPISIFTIDTYYRGFIFLNATLMSIDPILMLIGGILSIALWPKPERH